jgi:NAD(P)-dependent dehydrogenase (short-subunit alcohol dehydrogenase family)
MSVDFTEKDVPNLDGFVAIVTGGNGGIGLVTTKILAEHGAKVYIAGRSAERVHAAIDELSKISARPLDLHFLQLDLLDLRSVKAAAAAFNAQESHLDILINNAGIMNAPFKLTVDGHESQWQANYLGPHVFTTSLLPKLLSTAAQYKDKTRVRVVNVSSDLAFSGPKTIDLKDPNLTNTKGLMELQQRYGHSKQATIRDAFELNNRYASQGVTGYALHPGIVKSGLQQSDPTVMGKVIRVLMKLVGSTDVLAASLNTLYAATSPAAPKTGAGNFYMPVGKLDPRSDKWRSDTKLNSELWEKSEKIASSI